MMGSSYPQKLYTAEFKREAVQLLETSGKSGALIAQKLGISDGSLYTWRKQIAEQEKRLSQAKAIRPRSRKSFGSFGPKMKVCARKGIS